MDSLQWHIDVEASHCDSIFTDSLHFAFFVTFGVYIIVTFGMKMFIDEVS